MNALILAGGGSKRMGRNKSLIARPDGTREIDHIASLAKQFCDGVYVSLKDTESIETDLPIITDLHPGEGPVAALESAAATCDGPLLVLGCDLFLLNQKTISHLIENRNSKALATSYKNRIDARAEPLCTIYEPAALALAGKALAGGQRCARHFLESLDPHLLELPEPAALDNANTPYELDECFTKLTQGVIPKHVRILYFAKLREARGSSEETIETLACTAAGLYEEVRFRHRLPLEIDSLRVAINGEFANWNASISNGDEVVFIPPVAGG
jgi:molybdopterin-guanine dinucleotide biosynthesis protein A